MGGYGSGRNGGKKKADHYRSLDANKLYRDGCLETGYHGCLAWLDGEEVVAKIRLSTNSNQAVLKYHFRSNGSDWEKVEQSVPVIWTPCHYGGRRPYFRCPGIVNGSYCGRRVVKLYLGGKYFLCRHCYNLAYVSQSEARHDRLLRRANKRRKALGGEPGIYSWIERPKGMWQKTYRRQEAEILMAERLATVEFMRVFTGHLTDEEIDMLDE